jgi:hypothetical protein
MRGDKLRAHTACRHDKLPPRALKPGEKPLKPYSSSWDEIAKAMDERKASSENPKEALSEEKACLLAKPKAKSGLEACDDGPNNREPVSAAVPATDGAVP